MCIALRASHDDIRAERLDLPRWPPYSHRWSLDAFADQRFETGDFRVAYYLVNAVLDKFKNNSLYLHLFLFPLQINDLGLNSLFKRVFSLYINDLQQLLYIKPLVLTV